MLKLGQIALAQLASNACAHPETSLPQKEVVAVISRLAEDVNADISGVDCFLKKHHLYTSIGGAAVHVFYTAIGNAESATFAVATDASHATTELELYIIGSYEVARNGRH